MIVKDFIEETSLEGLGENDLRNINRIVNIDLFDTLRFACGDLINVIEDDAAFNDAEWNFMHYWYKEKGFTEEDWKYVEACGYEYDQFEGRED